MDKGELGNSYYSDKAPGVSFLAVLPLALTKLGNALGGFDERQRSTQRAQLHFLTIAISGLAGVLATIFLRRILLELGATSGQALGLALAYGLGTPALPFSTVMFGHQTAAALLTASFWVALRVPREGGRQRHLGLGLLWGMSIITEYPTALAVMVLGLYTLSRMGSWTRRAQVSGWMALGALGPLTLHSTFLFLAYGSPVHLPYKNVVEPMFLAHTSSGLFGVGIPSMIASYGVLLSRYRGLFYLSPFLALFFAGAGAWILSGAKRKEALATFAIALFYSLFVTSYWAWDGGGSAGPRHIVPVLPFLSIPALFFVQRWRHGKAATLCVAIPSIAIMYLITAVQVQVGEGDILRFDTIYKATIPPLLHGDLGINHQELHSWNPEYGAAYNMGSLIGLSPILSLLVPFGWWGLAGAAPTVVARLTKRSA